MIRIRSTELIAERLCWTLGGLLMVTYFGATQYYERERRTGIELFTLAQAAAETSGLENTAQTASIHRDEPDPPTGHADSSLDHSLPVALLRMPRIKLEVPVFDDISERNLSRGAGWIPGTAMPNDGGNMAIAAHRDQYFRVLKDVLVGDLLQLESLSGQRDYTVTSVTIVAPEDLWPLASADEATVTLVTCYPFYYIGNAPQRYIVQAHALE